MTETMVGAPAVERCRLHLERLLAHGWTMSDVSDVAGVPPASLQALVYGRSGRRICRMKRENFRAIMALEPEGSHGFDVVDAKGPRAAVLWLLANGFDAARIAREAGISETTVHMLKTGRHRGCRRDTAEKVARAAMRLRRRRRP